MISPARTIIAGAMLFICAAIPRAVLAQSAMLVGTVLIDSLERPLVNAEVAIPKLNLTTRSDSSGHFILSGLPAGRNEVLVRMVGYESFTTSLVFGATQKLDADFLLRPVVTKLAAVKVKDAKKESVNIRIAEFEERRKYAQGRFVTADTLEKFSSQLLSDVLMKKMPGIKGIPLQGSDHRAIASARGMVNFKNTPCYVLVYVNGMQVSNGTPFDIDNYGPGQLLGVEYYTSAQTPVQYSRTGASCGTMLVWMK